jgi:Trypsin
MQPMLTSLRVGAILIVAGCTVAAPAAATAHARPIIRPHRPLRANILGGTTAVGTTLGMVAHIIYNDGSDIFLCSGTVVASNVILTAGHCGEDEGTGVATLRATIRC